MSNSNSRISIQETTWLDISVPPEMVPEFKQMVIRATNTWQDMSTEMRMFMDRILGQEVIMEATYSGKVSKKNKIVVAIGCPPAPVLAEPEKPYKCPECKTVPCSCTFTHY